MSDQSGKQVVYVGVIAALSVVIAVLVMALMRRPAPSATPSARFVPTAASPGGTVSSPNAPPTWGRRAAPVNVVTAAPARNAFAPARPSTVVAPPAATGATAPSVVLPGQVAPRAVVKDAPLPAVPSAAPARTVAPNAAGYLGTPGRLPAQPASPNAGAFEAYVRWLESSESQRKQLRANILERSRLFTASMVGALAGVDDADPRITADYVRRAHLEAERTQQVLAALLQSVTSSKPPVPDDCRQLDEAFLSGIRIEVKYYPALVGLASSRVRPQQMQEAVQRYVSDANRHLDDAYKSSGTHPKLVFDPTPITYPQWSGDIL